MVIVRSLLIAVLGYMFYSVINRKYKINKRNEIKYDDYAVHIPAHLCRPIVVEKETAYKIVKWKDIKAWEYSFITHTSLNNTVWLTITTELEVISVSDVGFLKMLRHFRKNVKDKQLVNISNRVEQCGILLVITLFLGIIIILFKGV